MKKHTGSCDKTCGHKLCFGHVSATPLIQQALNRDPRVVEYSEIEDGNIFEFTYAYSRPVAAIYKVSARDLGIVELS
jgi:hypothetical protein